MALLKEFKRTIKVYSCWQRDAAPSSMVFCVALLLGLTGLSQAAVDERPLMRDFMGINGHTVKFRPELYRPVCGLVRDYHPVAWDLAPNTVQLPPFPAAKNGVDWSQVYGSWQAKGWQIDVCLMFESIERTKWADIEGCARAYGKKFAQEFGPSGTRKLVDSVEIGNEPGKWSDADYSQIFQAMAEGIREGDPKLKIATCNISVDKSGDYDKSVSCVEKFPALFDVLNVHTYAQLEGWPTWRRSFPEDPHLSHYLPDVESLSKWRDANAPGKPIWITEFGYDSTTQPQQKTGTFAKWVGVTDEQQAQWLLRSLLVFSSMPVERAYIYFFNDEDEASVHASSGITRHFQPKPSFYALAHLQAVLGDTRFQRIVTNEPGHLRVQEYRDDAKKIVWVVWSPTGSGQSSSVTLNNLPGSFVTAESMPLKSGVPDKPAISLQGGGIALQVSESPTYLVFKKD